MAKITPLTTSIIFSTVHYVFIFFFLLVMPVSYAEEGEQSSVQFDIIEVEDASIETIDATSSNLLLDRFKATNSNIRVHELHKTADEHTKDESSPSLQLERIYVGDKNTLLEIIGLNRSGDIPSAVIRSDTFGIREKSGLLHNILSHEGVDELRDKKGGVALVVNPGDRLFVLTGTINDSDSFSIEHTSWRGNTFTYFDGIDPRFHERYLKDYNEAVTPIKMKDFIVEYSNNDPDKKVREIFVALIEKMRQQNTFEGYYNAYLLLQDPQDANKAYSLARTMEHKTKMEHIAVATLRDKGRLINFDLVLDKTHTTNSTGSCWMFCNYSFTASRKISGLLKAHLKPSAPIKLKYGTYKVTFTISGTVPSYLERRSSMLGNIDTQSSNSFSKDFSVTLSPPNYVADLTTSFGSLNVAFFERGSAGGYTANWASGNGKVSIILKSVELKK